MSVEFKMKNTEYFKITIILEQNLNIMYQHIVSFTISLIEIILLFHL